MGENGTLVFRAFDEEDWVVFEIRDSGPGIPEEIHHKVFESFVTSGKKGGTGLGLAIVKKIVEEHKGEIEIESQPGRGATFRIKISVQAKYRAKAQEHQTA
jgi:signal transduction histidine kinase